MFYPRGWELGMRIPIFLAMCIAVALPCSARAGDAHCLWNKIPPSRQRAIIDGYATGGSDAITMALQREDSTTGIIACLTKPLTKEAAGDLAEASGGAQKGIAMQFAAEALLLKRFGMHASELDAAWRALPNFDKRTLGKASATNTSSADANKAMLDALKLAMPTLAAPALVKDPRLPYLQDYFVGRALRAFQEPLF
jgi:hypothetical protein